jgi:hypothetical protein
MKKNITPFYCIIEDFNAQKFGPYDVMPYFMRTWEYDKSHKHLRERLPKSYAELRNWIEGKSRYMYWARCEYEIVLHGWPDTDTHEKWDIHQQIMMNIDLLVRIFAENIDFDKYLEKLETLKNSENKTDK